ncbi:response regulator transcription factor [Paenibacillus sp. SC116]|uniref:response regulator transcription factor n=1 Tax=Paenibacillus sp. SC116 TaxID=2968986 RepID=UPI00215A6C73|nr:response regulator transcription factor [Paenibacillus sp. SC116]MCR8843617.1 response regulator transcription factor [Paenibacillus sp. SC116]
MANILIVDDDPDILELIRFYLHRDGFKVNHANNGVEAIERLSEEKMDLVIVDIMMPQMDGWDLCRALRNDFHEMPILMVTAKGETEHKIKSFNLGADDYLVKPFDPIELVARVKLHLKRYHIQSSMKVQVGNVLLDKNRYEAVIGSIQLSLPLREFDLLYKLASYPGKIFTRNDLIEQVWGAYFEGDDRTVDVHIKRLRDRFAALDCAFTIETKRGLGYKLEEQRT